ncbi:MAG: FtsX-like permease family protein [Desulfobacterales bacterium]|jgi:putative ABC transport system permease protein
MGPLIRFLILFYRFSCRHILRHRLRSVAVLVGIALGAAVFTGVRLSVRASLDAFTRSVDLVAGDADLAVSRPGGRVPEEIIKPLLEHPQVEAISAFSSVYVREDRPSSPSFLLIGIDPIMDRQFRSWAAEGEREPAGEGAWSRLMAEPLTMMVGPELAEERDWRKGDAVRLVHAHQTASFRILGRLDAQGLALAQGGRVAICDIATFQEFTGTIGRLDRVDIRTSDRTGAVDLSAVLPEGVRVSRSSAVRESGRGMIRAYQLNLSVLGFASLFVGMFLVYSLISLNAASRRREIAVLRSLGASRRSIFLLFLAEGGVYGLAGWILAIPLGTILIRYLLAGVSQTISTLFVRVVVQAADLSLLEALLSLLVTVGVSLLAALQPAREAMSVTPMEAMSPPADSPAGRTSPTGLALAGLGCIAVVGPLSAMPGLGGAPIPGYLGMLMLFGGFSLLAPLGIRWVGRWMSPMSKIFGGVPALLAARYIRDTGPRTAISVGALITAVALYSALVIMIHSFRTTVDLWVHQTISGDLFLTTRNAEVNQIWEPFSTSEMIGISQMAEDAGVDMVPSRRFTLAHGDTPYQIDFLDLAAFHRNGRFIWMKGDPEAAMPAHLRGDGVVVSEVFANRTGIGYGGRFEAVVDGVELSAPVLGVVRDYRTRGGVVFASLQGFGPAFGGLPWGGVRFFLDPSDGDSDAAVDRLRDRILDRFGDRFDMMSGRDLRAAVLRIFDETFAVTGVLLLIALSVAALGITTTMTVLVLERTRQFNTILAVGGSGGQARRIILWETVFMVVFGEFAGLVCGFMLSYLLVFVINRQSFGWTFLYSIDYGGLILSLPLILLTALAAALPAVGVAFRHPPAMLLRDG